MLANRMQMAAAGTGFGNDANTVLLLHCDGSDTSTTFTDDSVGGNHGNATANGDAQVDTAQQKFGTGSLLCDGTGDFLSYAYDTDWNFGTGDFTLDFWLRLSTTGTDSGLLSHLGGAGSDGWSLRYLSGTGLRFLTDSGGATDRAWSPSTATWYHVALIRTGTTMRMFIDGSQIGADISNSEDLTNTTQTLYIGADHVGTRLNGWMDEIRISKGIARWTTTFTPPTRAYQ